MTLKYSCNTGGYKGDFIINIHSNSIGGIFRVGAPLICGTEEYLGVALAGTLVGASAGFAIVGAIYTAPTLAYEAIIRLPEQLFKPLVIKGAIIGSYAITESIAVLNALFRTSELTEAITGSNFMKNLIYNFLGENLGQDVYELGSALTFILSMQMIFYGASVSQVQASETPDNISEKLILYRSLRSKKRAVVR